MKISISSILTSSAKRELAPRLGAKITFIYPRDGPRAAPGGPEGPKQGAYRIRGPRTAPPATSLATSLAIANF